MEIEHETPAPPPANRWKRRGFVLLIVAVAVVFCVYLADRSGKRRMDRLMDQARSQGLPFTFDEIIAARTPVAEQEDAAPVFLQLQDGLAAQAAAMKNLPIMGDGELPALGRLWDSQTSAAVSTGLQLASDELNALSRIKEYAGGAIPLSVAENPIDTLLPFLGNVRVAVRLQSLAATARAMDGEAGQLPDDVAVMRRVGHLVAQQPTLVSSLVTIACGSLTVSTVERVCSLTEPAPDALKRIEQILTEMEAEDPLYWGLLGERAMFVSMAQWSLNKRRPPTQGIPALSRLPILRGMGQRDVAAGLDLYNQMAGVLKNPQARLTVANELDRQVLALPRYYVFTRNVMPSLRRACEMSLNGTAELRCARAGLAIERYRQAKGAFPADLLELVPAYLPAVPMDPFDTVPLRYKTTDSGVIIYSIGDDKQDQGGDVAKTRGQPRKDVGFVLLRPDQRRLPPLPASTPASEPGLEGRTASE